MGEIIASSIGRRVQVRTAAQDRWTKTKREAFLDYLAATCNVVHSARHVGVATNTAHGWRRRDPAFALAWSAALEQGYEFLEAKLLAMALGDDPERVRAGDPEAVPFNPEMALRMLASRKGMNKTGPRGRASVKRVPIAQVEASLRRKLDALEKRLKGAA